MQRLDLHDWMRQCNGIAHSSVLREAGFSEATVRRAVRAGLLTRVRRSWLVTPDCHPARRTAAAAGGRLSCLSAAAARGLWTPVHDGVHVAVAANASRHDSSGLYLHWARGPVPVTRTTAEEPILNVLFHVARCADPGDALAVWESALRTGLVDPEVLVRVPWSSPAARRLAEVADVLSDSGVETRFVALMRGAGVVVRQQVWVDGHPLDGLIGERLAVQLDGFAHHSQPRDRRRDLRADARLALRGYTVLRFDYQQVLFDPVYVRDTVLTAVAQGLHRAA